MTAAFERGMSSSDFEEMEIGAIVDYIVTYNNLRFDDNGETRSDEKSDKPVIRRATQDDWNAFSS